jgi:hypothetical protein
MSALSLALRAKGRAGRGGRAHGHQLASGGAELSRPKGNPTPCVHVCSTLASYPLAPIHLA